MRPCTRPTFAPRTSCSIGRAFFGGGEIDLLGFLHQRANPIGARALAIARAQMLDHFVQALGAEHARLDRLASRRTAGEARHIHVAIGGQRQRARDRRRRHHQHVGGLSPLPCSCMR